MVGALVVLLCGAWDLPTRLDGDVEDGNLAYRDGDYDSARAAYERALAGEGDAPRLHFDLGAALYKLAAESAEVAERARLLASAETSFRRAAESRDPRLKASAYYNLGNVLYQRERYEDAAGAYRKVLRLDSSHDDARYNLELALRERPPAEAKAGSGPGPKQPRRGGPEAPAKPDRGQGQAAGQPPDGEDREGDEASEGEPRDAEGGGDRDRSGRGPRESDGAEAPPTSEGEDQREAGGDSDPMDEREREGRRGDAAKDDPPRPAAGPGAFPDDVDRKLRALERRSRELRRRSLRDGARDGQPSGTTSGKDW